MADRYKILRNVYKKLDNLPLGFGVPPYSDEIADADVDSRFGIDLDDTLREIRINISDVSDPYDELQVENRVIYYALRRYRLSASVYFKFSTAVDGKSIDKTMIPKMMSNLISEYNNEFARWRSSKVSSVWTRTAILNYTSSTNKG